MDLHIADVYIFNYCCHTWPPGQHLVDSGIALCSKSLTVPNSSPFILSKLMITLMGFQGLDAATHTNAAHHLT
jgi:hypothetical protein